MKESLIPDQVAAYLEIVWVQGLLILAASLVVAFLLNLIASRILSKISRETASRADDHLLAYIHRPIYLSVILAGLQVALTPFELSPTFHFIIAGTIKTLITIIWAHLLWRFTTRLFGDSGIARVEDGLKPMFENLGKILIIGLGSYFLFLAWNVDVTAWLASAGVVGIAVGFAAKDSLANLISGIFITADKPYKIGDYIVLDSGERGRVTQIGMRSTRILTWADVEIIIPNAVIANSKITNQSGGFNEKMATTVEVGVAYGSDVDRVREILYEISRTSDVVCREPEPVIRFTQLGDSALHFRVAFWVPEPVRVAAAQDEIITQIYKRFKEEGIEIPYPQLTIHKPHEELD